MEEEIQSHFEFRRTSCGFWNFDNEVLLYISKDEQKSRLKKREKDPNKSWKLSLNDWKERDLWDDYMEAYEDAITNTSTKHAPWFVVPANNKWYRDLIISQVIVDTMSKHRDEWHKELVKRGEIMRAELATSRPARNGNGKVQSKEKTRDPLSSD